MIIMSGWKIYPTEVENMIIRHPAVADIAVFGVPDERRGEIPVAAIVFRPGMALSEEELGTYCRDLMAGYKIPRKVMVTNSLPRVHGWKLLRRELRDKFSNSR
jgi:long-chain acyl-CoA synthetase